MIQHSSLVTPSRITCRFITHPSSSITRHSPLIVHQSFFLVIILLTTHHQSPHALPLYTTPYICQPGAFVWDTHMPTKPFTRAQDLMHKQCGWLRVCPPTLDADHKRKISMCIWSNRQHFLPCTRVSTATTLDKLQKACRHARSNTCCSGPVATHTSSTGMSSSAGAAC